MPYVLHFFYPTALATAYGQMPKFVRTKHSAAAEGENGKKVLIARIRTHGLFWVIILPIFGDLSAK